MNTENIAFVYDEENGHDIIEVAWTDIFACTGDHAEYYANRERYDAEIIQRLLNSGAPKWVATPGHIEGRKLDDYWVAFLHCLDDDDADILHHAAAYIGQEAEREGAELTEEYILDKLAWMLDPRNCSDYRGEPDFIQMESR